MELPILVNELCSVRDIVAIALGGSRSINQHNDKSDYDIFCVISNSEFNGFRHTFVSRLEKYPFIKYAAFLFYLENWGYLFKAVDVDGNLFDISIISESRIDEMSIRSTNLILKDSSGIYLENVKNAHDSDYQVGTLESLRTNDYATLFGFERLRFTTAINNNDYWYAVRCLERLKNYYIRCNRIEHQRFPKSQSCPEKGYEDYYNTLSGIYIIDGTISALVQTFDNLCEIFDSSIKDKRLRERAHLI